MIQRISILPGFQQGNLAFPLEVFPVGAELQIDSPLVYLVGPNGSGKSTFLNKLWLQSVQNNVSESVRKHSLYRDADFEYFRVESDISHWRADFLKFSEPSKAQLSYRGIERDGERFLLVEADSRLSSGQHRWRELQQLYEVGSQVVLLDQPEDNLDMVARRTLAEMVNELATSSQQYIVATHEAGLLKASPRAKVVSLYDTPAKVYSVPEFAKKYL